MQDLRPLLGLRRREAIDAALAGWTAPARRLDFGKAEQIRASFATGERVSSLATTYGVARATVRAVLGREIYRAAPTAPWRALTPPFAAMAPGLCWLAGWLEGEGTFLAPPPSDPRRPRIAGQCRDEDVIVKVAQLFGVKPTVRIDPRGVDRGWSPLYKALLRGSRAISLMHAIRPLLGARRQAQIDRALSRTRAAGGATIEDDTYGGEPASTWS